MEYITTFKCFYSPICVLNAHFSVKFILNFLNITSNCTLEDYQVINWGE